MLFTIIRQVNWHESATKFAEAGINPSVLFTQPFCRSIAMMCRAEEQQITLHEAAAISKARIEAAKKRKQEELPRWPFL